MPEPISRFVRLSDYTGSTAFTLALAMVAEAIKASHPTFGMPLVLQKGDSNSEVFVEVFVNPYALFLLSENFSESSQEHNAMYETAFENLPEEHQEILDPFKEDMEAWSILVSIAEVYRNGRVNLARVPSSLKELADAVDARR